MISSMWGQGSEGPPQLVREHREELVLAAVGVAQRVLRRGDRLVLLLARQVGDEDADEGALVHAQRVEDEVGRDGAAVLAAEADLPPAGLLPALREQRLVSRAVLGDDEIGERLADEVVVRDLQHLGEPSVGVEDGAVAVEGRNALLHLLDEHPVRAGPRPRACRRGAGPAPRARKRPPCPAGSRGSSPRLR
jgi:hypothetical protein